MLLILTATSCTRSLNLQEDINDNVKILQHENFKPHAKESDSTKTSSSEDNVGLYPDPDGPDIPIKDTHDWRQKPL